MNRNPNQRSGNRPTQPNRSNPQPYDPRRAAARRAYLARRKKQIRRNRIILACAAVLFLAVCVLLVSMILRGIAGAIDQNPDKDNPTRQTDTQTASDKGLPGIVSGESEETAQTPVGTTAETQPAEPEYELNFQSDLSDYESYMDPKGELRDAYLILVNSQNPLPSDYVPDDLVDVQATRRDGRETQKMQRCAEKALEALYIEAQAQGMVTPDTPSGYPLSVTSAYRSYDKQAYLFSLYTQNELAAHAGWTKAQAEARVETYSCRPGTSEHQTGLCCDMHILSAADVSFENYEQAKWLAENSWKFGFILRFPKDKTGETGISYEPWHFRYVGRYHAYQIWSQGLCLEEYIASGNF